MSKTNLGVILSDMATRHDKPIKDKIVLYAKSKEGDADWYGDFNYFDNPLDRYHESKMCHVEYEWGRGRGCGVASMTVTTTMKFIEMMGWEEDLKYKVKFN